MERMLAHLTNLAQGVAQISVAIQRDTSDSGSASVQLWCCFKKPGGVGGKAPTTAYGPAISGILSHAELLHPRDALVQIPPATEKLRPNVIGCGYRTLQYIRVCLKFRVWIG